MAPKIVTNVSELTKELIAEMYFNSLGNREMRPSHVPLIEASGGGGPGRAWTKPPDDVINRDFAGWYGGLTSLAHGIDPGVALPTLKECAGYVTQNFERAKTAIAA
jgi:hypothetical protein